MLKVSPAGYKGLYFIIPSCCHSYEIASYDLKPSILLENTPVEAEISHNQEDWFNSLEEELIQVQEDLNFYNNILEEFMAKDIISLGLNSKGDTIQESSAVMITADTAMTVDITASAIILDDVSVINDSCA